VSQNTAPVQEQRASPLLKRRAADRVAGPAAPTPILETLHNLLSAAWRRRYLIVLPVLLLPVVGGVLSRFAPRSYEARMSILIQDPGKLNPFLEDLAVKNNLKDRMEALRALLTSRHVLARVAQDLGKLDDHSTDVQRDRAVAELAAAVSVQLIGNEMVELRYQSSEPRGMDKVLTGIKERFMEEVRAPEMSSMQDSVEFLKEQLQKATDRLTEAEKGLSLFKTANADKLPELRGTNLQRLTQLGDTLSEREVQLAGAEAQLATTQERLVQTDPVIGRLEQDIVSVRSELALLRSRYTEEHSSVQGAERKLARLEEERGELMRATAPPLPADADRMWNMAAVATNRDDGSQPLLVSQVVLLQQARLRVEQLRGEVANLRSAVQDLRTRVEGSGETERQLRDQEREVQVGSDLVAQLRKRSDMANVTSELSRFQENDRIVVIDKPVEPTRPTKPLTLLYTIGGLVAGIALGIGLAVVTELMDTTVRTARMMQRITGIPVLARIRPFERRLL
jgi:polysaccharide chain length determinant protein (PEP-CTERM system associated)